MSYVLQYVYIYDTCQLDERLVSHIGICVYLYIKEVPSFYCQLS